MKKKTTTIRNIKITYLIKNDWARQSIFFVHSNSGSSRSWIPQLIGQVLNNYRLIAFDLPSHGNSGISPNPEVDYSLPGLAKIITEAVRLLADNKPYILSGLSLGSNIIAEMLAYDLKPAGIVLAGSTIVGKGYSSMDFIFPNTHVDVVFSDGRVHDDIETYAYEANFSDEPAAIKAFMKDYTLVKDNFRSIFFDTVLKESYNDEIELLTSSGLSTLVIFGENDKIVDNSYLDKVPFKLHNQKVYKIPKASHMVNTDQPDVFNNLLADYAREIFK